MRFQLLKLKTKGEKRVGEILKRHRIKFKAKQRVGKYEVDFVIGNVVLEVDGEVHQEIKQEKDVFLAQKGFVPLHIQDKEISAIEKELLYLIRENNKYARRLKTIN